MEVSRRFATQWNLLCWKYKIHKFYFGYKHKIHEPVNFNQTTKIDTHKEKYFHSNYHMKKPCQKVYTLCINLNLFCLYKVPVLVVFLGLAAVVCWFEELDVCCWYWVGCWFWVSWLGAVFGRVLVLMVKNIIWFK